MSETPVTMTGLWSTDLMPSELLTKAQVQYVSVHCSNQSQWLPG